MTISPSTLVADIATASPATIKVFQRHKIDFCCGGKIPLAEACALHGLDPARVLAELAEVDQADEDSTDWTTASLAALVDHIQGRFHGPLRHELPRLAAMVDRVVSRHGERLPDTLPPLQRVFHAFKNELIDHMMKEDAILFPAIVALERGHGDRSRMRLVQPITVMEAEHALAGAALEGMRALTDDYTLPDWACPTFRGLFHGLAEVEREMHVHVHLENNVLFPRASAMTSA